MIEATIKKIYGERKTITRDLTGVRCSIKDLEKRDFPPGTYHVRIWAVIKTRKGSRMRKEKYKGTWLTVVDLEDIVVDDYEED